MIFNTAKGEVGTYIKDKCKDFADREAEKEEDKKVAYFYCRLTNTFRATGANMPRSLTVKEVTLAKETKLTDVLREVEKEVVKDMSEVQKLYLDEVKARVEYLKRANATKAPIPYIATKVARRAVTSTIGNAIAKRAGMEIPEVS